MNTLTFKSRVRVISGGNFIVFYAHAEMAEALVLNGSAKIAGKVAKKAMRSSVLVDEIHLSESASNDLADKALGANSSKTTFAGVIRVKRGCDQLSIRVHQHKKIGKRVADMYGLRAEVTSV